MRSAGAAVQEVAKEQLPALLRAEAQPLFAVLDAARDAAILDLLAASGEEHRSLYAGRRAERLATVAPYLVRLPPHSPLLDTLISRSWSRSWGFYISCDRSFDELRRHLRRFLVIETEDGQALHFRFYDPRVLRPYLASCTPEEVARFCGPARALWLEGRPPATLLRVQRPELTIAPAPRGMPLVRDAQMDALSQELVEVFLDRMVARLEAEGAGELAGWGAVRGDLRAAVRAAVDRAEGYGIHRERDLERFVALLARLGPKFDLSLPWAAEILRRGDLGPRRKLQSLEQRLAGDRPAP